MTLHYFILSQYSGQHGSTPYLGSVRRNADGLIDVEYYIAGAHRLRSETIRRGLTNGLRALSRVGEHLLTTLQRWREHRSTYQMLMALDDHILKDIGIGRSEIPAIASGLWIPDHQRHGAGGLQALHPAANDAASEQARRARDAA
ncbi:MAG: DUF1127 domain-containing protein [Gammaproteobacteria bacterium]